MPLVIQEKKCQVNPKNTDEKACQKICLPGWGSNAANCYPQAAVLTCSATGFILSGLTKTIMYEKVDALTFGKTYGINANGKNVGYFDDTDGTVTINQKWNDIQNLQVTHESNKIKFEVEISADDPTITHGSFQIHTTRTDKFKIICSFNDKTSIKIDPLDVKIGNDLGIDGSVEKNAPENVWASTFSLNVYSDSGLTTKITSDAPIELGSPVYSKIATTELPTALQFFVSNCEAKASASDSETTKIAIFNKYECYNSVFGNAASVFMTRAPKEGSLTEYQFKFPAFTFSSIVDDELHLACSITICPASTDCIETSYSAQRKIDDTSCDGETKGYKANIAPERR